MTPLETPTATAVGRDKSLTSPAPLADGCTDRPYLIDLLSSIQRRQLRVLVGTWLVGQIVFWGWWLRPEHVVTWVGIALNSLLFVWTTLLPGWYVFFVSRMKEPNPELDCPPGTVAMVVTKTPAEPWPTVRRVLEAMLVQHFPRPYDVWLADEDPSDESRAWCAQRGVSISCRKGVVRYHNEHWPR